MKAGQRLLLAAGLAALMVGTASAERWSGAGGDDNWTTAANWTNGVAPPSNPETDIIYFDDADSGNTNVVDAGNLTPASDTWTIGGIESRQYAVDGVVTQTIDMAGNTLVVAGDIHVTDRAPWTGSEPYSSELIFANGTVQWGTPGAPIDVSIGQRRGTDRNYYGVVSFLPGTHLVPYVETLEVGFGNNSTGAGTFDLNNATVEGGVLAVTNFYLSYYGREPISYFLLDNTNGVHTLQVEDIFNMAFWWGDARMGYPTGGADDEHKLPEGFNIIVGKPDAPASELWIGYSQYNTDGRIFASTGGTFTAYVDDMRLADVALNSQTRHTYGILEIQTMDSCTIVASNLVVSKDYPDEVTGEVNPRAHGSLRLPAGTLVAGTVELDGHHPDSEALLELNGTFCEITNSLSISTTSVVRVNVMSGPGGINDLDLGSSSLSIEEGGLLELDFNAAGCGFRWEGDHVAELQALETAGKLVIDDSAIAPAEVSIFLSSGATFIGIPAPQGTVITLR